MKANRNSSRNQIAAWTLFAMAMLLAQVSSGAQTYHFANGISATVHGADEINDALVLDKDGGRELVHPAVGSLVLDAAGRDWVPMDEYAVVGALESMTGFATHVDVDVFVLPAPPAEIGSSFARRGAIYLSPGTGVVPASTIAYVTTHEMGHVLTWAFLDGRQARWDEYLQVRGLDESNLSTDARHADRAREIIAEDIRFLFGGSLATRSGTIENHDLVTPDRVAGLDSLLAGYFRAEIAAPRFVAARAFPNPCNPLTTIEMALDSDSDVTSGSAVLRIYDIRGALISTVVGGHVANGSVSIQWHGTDDFGGAAASGRYLYQLQLGRNLGKGSVTLVR